MMTPKFCVYSRFYGLIEDDGAGSSIYGYETISKDNESNIKINIPNSGGCFVVVQRGEIEVEILNQTITIGRCQWLSTVGGFDFLLKKDTIVVIFQKINYSGMNAFGEVEDDGRLNYIDGCKDTLLFQPIKFGLPCLNALFIPNGVDQTTHTHPSTRAGIILKGDAYCNVPENEYKLQPGMIFIMSKDQHHKFRTNFHGGNLTLVAYHPDSDVGPTDDNHAMLNRTLVNNVSANKIESIKTKSHV